MKNRKKIKIIKNIFFIEHNSIYDDILFLIPLYSIIIKTKIVVICSDDVNINRNINIMKRVENYTTYNNCIYIDIDFIKYLQIHSNIFRFCKYIDVYNILRNKTVNYFFKNIKICKESNYTSNYSLVTTIYKRNNLQQQLKLFLNQALPPKYIIIVHDRNYIKLPNNKYEIIYFHTINFKAGYYLRYLLSILSPENEVIIYDDDWFPYNNYSHFNWINSINEVGYGLFGHHSASKNGIRWCGTPLIIHRKWLYLMWLNDLYEPIVAEDGHLSFSLLLLCNIKCITKKIHGLNYKSDYSSSSAILNISKSFWTDYTNNVLHKINSSYVLSIKTKYNIY